MLDLSLSRSSGGAKLLVDFAARHDVPAARCLRGTGLTESDLDDPLFELATGQEVRIVENLVDALPFEDLGLRVGSMYPVRLFGIYGFAVMSAATMRDMVELALRYQDLALTLARARLARRPPFTFIELDANHLPRAIQSFVVDHALAIVVRTWTDMDDDAPTPRVELQSRQSSLVNAYRETLGVTPRFGAGGNRIGFLDAELDRIRNGVDRQAFAVCEQECRALILKRKARVGISGIVRDRLERTTGRPPSMEDIAAELHLSARSLRRALAAEGTLYRAIDRDAREHRVNQMLTAGWKVSAIADCLGYCDSAAFVNAYKRWHCVSPGRDRRRVMRIPVGPQ
jgi:AraC-like DNA-binding protein